MTTANPLLENAVLPRFSAILPEHVEPAVDSVLADYRVAIDALLASNAPRDFATVILAGEECEDRLNRVWAPVSHLHGVADSEGLRKAYSAAQEKIVEHASALGQNRELYAAVESVAGTPAMNALPRAARTLVEHELRDFRLSGVALEEPARSRFREIANELARLATEFEEAVLDATDAWSESIETEFGLAGIPASGRATLREYAQEKSENGWRVTLKQPSVQAVLTYADDRALRERVYRAYQTRASDEGPNAGTFDNSRRIDGILALRHEAAQLLGFADAAEESLATKMAPSPDAVFAFLHDLALRAKPVAQRELVELRAFAADELGIADLQPWDVGYASEKLRERKYALNEEELKPYFALDPVIAGLFAITERVFGITLKQRTDVDVWHADVRYYDLVDANGKVFAGTYVDLFARSGKRGGAWMDVCVNRFVRERSGHANSLQLPVAFLTCNFAPPTATTPSLLTHDDVLTLFHEFGHGLHHLLTDVDYPGVAGINGVEWDAVELPSQFMENFGWQRAALDLFARHWQTGAALPDELFARMQAARHFHAGLFLVRQLEFALFDFRIHREFDPVRGARALEILGEVRAEVAVLQAPHWQRFPHAFTHVFAGGYGAGYYSYLWAEVLSADAFGRFEEAGVFDRATGEAYRRAILSVGGSRPALESFVEFRGRVPDPAALLRSYGLVTGAA
ncbi:MAG: M3 family metallopeptidase [Dokdonella sp.]